MIQAERLAAELRNDWRDTWMVHRIAVGPSCGLFRRGQLTVAINVESLESFLTGRKQKVVLDGFQSDIALEMPG